MFTENLLFYKEESLIMAFIDTIKERAKADKKTIVLPESMDKRTYEAAEKILKEGIANLVIIGTPEEIEKYAAAKTGDMRGIFLYILCDYTGKIVSIAMGGIGTDSLDNLHPIALNVEKFARLIEAIEKRWKVELFYKENPEPCYQIYAGDIFHFKLFPDWVYKPFDQRPAAFTLPELR